MNYEQIQILTFYSNSRRDGKRAPQAKSVRITMHIKNVNAQINKIEDHSILGCSS